MADRFRKFADYTTIHGVKDTMNVKYPMFKFVWALCLLGSISGAFYFIFNMAVVCSNEPTTTKLSWLKQEFYDSPPISFCPTNWINETSALSLHFDRIVINFLEEMSDPVSVEMPEYELFSEPVIRALALTNLSSLPDLYLNLSLDPKDVLTCKSCTDIVRIYQMYHICYRIFYGPLFSREITTYGSNYLIYKNIYRSMSEFSGQIIIGENVYSQAVLSSIHTRPGHIYLIQVQAKQIISLSKRHDPCDWEKSVESIASLDVARMNCTTQLNTEAILCAFCAGYQKSKVLAEHEHEELYEKSDLRLKCDECALKDLNTDACKFKDFLPPCKRWVYEYTFNTETMGRSGETRSDIVIEYMPVYGIESLEEVLTYNWEAFLSNIGGQLGLWLGASFLSLFQMFYYICVEPYLDHRHRLANQKNEPIIYVTKC